MGLDLAVLPDLMGDFLAAQAPGLVLALAFDLGLDLAVGLAVVADLVGCHVGETAQSPAAGVHRAEMAIVVAVVLYPVCEWAAARLAQRQEVGLFLGLGQLVVRWGQLQLGDHSG